MRWLLLFSILFSLTLHADEKADLKQLRESAKQLVRQAMDNGYRQIEGVPLNELLSALDQPEMYFMKNIKVQHGNRRGAIYQTDEHNIQILINKDVVKETQKERVPLWILHELIGATRYYDRGFQLSVQIYYAAISTNSIANKIVQERQLAERKGTGTRVGGGGDPELSFAKTLLIDHVAQLQAQGQQTYNGISLKRIAELTILCDFEFYNGNAVVQPFALGRSFAVPDPKYAGQKRLMNKPWIQLSFRKEWLQDTPSQQSTLIQALLDGMVVAINEFKNAKDICHMPAGTNY